MLNLREVEEAIRQLENGSATYNNCMKLASLYIVRDELRKKEGMYNYGYNYNNSNYTAMPMMYERGRSSNSSYGYREPMFYENEDLMIKKNMDSMPSEYARR